MENLDSKFIHIKGWGVDEDVNNNPTYPIKVKNRNEVRGYQWHRPTQQESTVEVLHSNERPNLSSVFGTSVPPSGLSGSIRRFAFQYSENSYLHWLPLLLADRINVLEGIVDDIKHGYVPNIFAEKGGKAIWKHNPKSIVQQVVAATVVLTAIGFLIYKKKSASKKKPWLRYK
jgi:hypothetical protein